MISATMLSSFSYCARKLWLQYVLKLKEPMKDVVILGTVTHQTYNAINKQDQELVTSVPLKATQTEILDMYGKRFSALLRWSVSSNKFGLKKVNVPLVNAFKHAWPMIQREAEIRAQNVYKNIQHHGIAGEALWDLLTPKIKSEYSVKAEKVGLKGIVDQLEVHRTFVRPIELKTGKAPSEGVWPGHRLQVGSYAVMLESVLGTQVEEAVVHYLEANTARTVQINPFIREEVLSIRDKVNETLASTTPPAKTQDLKKCESCGLRSSCYDDAFIDGKAKSLNTSRSIAIVE